MRQEMIEITFTQSRSRTSGLCMLHGTNRTFTVHVLPVKLHVLYCLCYKFRERLNCPKCAFKMVELSFDTSTYPVNLTYFPK
jgi:hypothetical protein